MTSKSDILTQSLIDYINDVKPYHTKFRDVSSQIFFADSFNVNIKDDHTIDYNLQNMWGRDDAGGYALTNMSEGAYASHPKLTGIGNGSLSAITLTTGSVVVETWTMVATSSTTFSVIGSTSGSQATATVGTAYNNGIVGFTINAGTKSFVSGDTFTFEVTGDQTYHLPTTIFPRFSITDHVGQTPPGDDPVNVTNPGDPWPLTPSHQVGDINQIAVNAIISSMIQIGADFYIYVDTAYETLYGFDDTHLQISVNGTIVVASYTKVGNVIVISNFSPALGPNGVITAEVLYIHTGRYAVPYHQGSRVYVDGIQQIFGTDYVVERSRDFIQFMIGKWPSLGAKIDINLFRSDRLFICWQDPFKYGTSPDQFTITASPSPDITTSGSFIVGETYTILSVGNTNFPNVGASNNNLGSRFTFTAPLINAGSFIVGKSYTIYLLGTTDFTLYGSPNNNLGTTFTATGVGTGTGKAFANYDTSSGNGLAASKELMAISVPTSDIIAGREYRILVEDQNFLLPELGGINLIGSVFTASKPGTAVAGNFIIGAFYKIISSGNTNFVSLGASDNNTGTTFYATGVGSGTGIAELSSPLFTRGIVAPTVTCEVTFVNAEALTHKASIQDAAVTNLANTGTWTVTPTGPWKFDVQKGSTITQARFKTPYDDGVLSFIIDRKWANYYMSSFANFDAYYIEQDPNSYISYAMLPLGTSDQYDSSEFFSNLNITSEHGDSTSTLQHPVRFEPFGVVKKNTTGVNEYVFELDKIPPAYTYIEFKVEQEGQYNPWVSAKFEEAMYIQVTFFLGLGALLIVGDTYTILDPGTTDFTVYGSPNNNPGTVFTATGQGSGNGTVTQIITGAGPSQGTSPVTNLSTVV